MPDQNPQGQPNATPAPAPASAPAEFKMPEKFAGKSAEEIAKAYLEIEKLHGETNNKLSSYNQYVELLKSADGQVLSPKDVKEVMDFARSTYQKLSAGELVDPKTIAYGPGNSGPKSVIRPTPDTSTGSKPWQAPDWEFKNDAEKGEAVADYARQEALKVIAEKEQQFGSQFQQTRNQLSAEQGILLDAINSAIQSGGKVDVKTLLTNAAALQAKSPQELLAMALKNITNPSDTEAEIDRRVNERVALKEQELENQRIKDITSTASPRPRIFAKRTVTRDTENAAILDKLAKDFKIKLY